MQTSAVETRPSAGIVQQKKVRRFRPPWIVVLAVVLVLAFQGAGEMQKVLAPPSAEWSRPLTVATAPSNRAFTQVVLPDGRLMVIWGSDKGFHSYLVSTTGKVEATASFLEDQAAPSGVRAVAGADRVILFWLDYAAHTLWTAAISPDGHVLTPAASFASGVTDFAVALGGEPYGPRLLVLAGGKASLYAPAEAGRWVPSPLPGSVESATALDLKGSNDGTLYAVVAQQDASNDGIVLLVGIRLPPAGGGQAFELIRIRLQSLKEALGALSLGMDRQNGYVFWDVERNDKGERSTLSRYVSWPLDQAPDRSLEPKALVSDATQSLRASGLSRAHPAPGQYDQLSVAVPATVGVGRDRVVETLELSFQGGRLIGQRLAAPSTSITLQPHLIRGGSDRWLTWVVPHGGEVELKTGSTAPAFRQAMGRIQGRDWLDAIGNTAVNLGFAYLPFLISLAWVLPTVMFVAVAHLLAINWAEHNQLALNLLGLGLYLWLKIELSHMLLFTPALLGKMPPTLSASLTWVLVGTLAVAALELLRRNRHALWQSVASGLMLLMLYDVVLTGLFAAPYVK